jgi:aryl-alcohol dehydrogenase-like predicted oxidoreductase
MKLCLGTVQFGLNYGINNNTGKIRVEEVIKILKFALDHDIATFDTARAYGDSEFVIGSVLKKIKKKFKIITKYSESAKDRPMFSIDSSLQCLRVEKIYGYLFHNYSTFQKHPDYIDDFIKIKKLGKAEKIGFSLYYPTEAEYILKNNIPCDIVQVPYNIFDQRFGNIFPALRARNIEIYIRSVFLQGLFFVHPDKLGEHFTSIRHLLHELSNFSIKNKLTIPALCLGFVNADEHIDKIVIGVDSLNNLEDNICNYNKLSDMSIDYQQFGFFSVTDENVILPFNWGK